MGLFRRTTVAALEGKRDIGRLIQALDDPARHAEAALALGRLGDRHAFEPLLALTQGSYLPMRVAAAQALGHLGDPRAVEPLITILRTSGYRTRDLGQAAATALAQLRDARAVPALLEMSSSHAVAQIGADAVEPLIGIARTREDLRCKVANVFTELCDPRSVPLLSELLETEPSCRETVAKALGVQGDVRAAGPLFAALLRLRPPEAWPRAVPLVSALGQLGTPAIDLLIAQLADPDPAARRMAARVLGATGDSRAAGKAAAAARLNELTTRAVGPLTAALHDADERVRGAAAGALWSLGAGNLLGTRQAALHDEFEPLLRSASAGLAVSELYPVLQRRASEMDADLLARVRDLPGTVHLGRPVSFDDPTEMTFSYTGAKRLASAELQDRGVIA